MSVQILQPHYHSEPKERKEPKESDFDKVYKALMLAKTGLGIYSDIDNLKTNYAKREEMDKTNKHNETVRPLEVEAKRLANDSEQLKQTSAVAKGYQDTVKANEDFKEKKRIENRKFNDEEIFELAKNPNVSFVKEGGPGIATYQSNQGNTYHVKGLDKEQMAKDKNAAKAASKADIPLNPLQQAKLDDYNRKINSDAYIDSLMPKHIQKELDHKVKIKAELEHFEKVLDDAIALQLNPDISDDAKITDAERVVSVFASSALGKTHIIQAKEAEKYGIHTKFQILNAFKPGAFFGRDRNKLIEQMRVTAQSLDSSVTDIDKNVFKMRKENLPPAHLLPKGFKLRENGRHLEERPNRLDVYYDKGSSVPLKFEGLTLPPIENYSNMSQEQINELAEKIKKAKEGKNKNET